ncbi:MAG: cellulase family glycosylhydrolase [Coprococcus sp.]
MRLAMHTSEYNGYCSGGNQAQLRNQIYKGVKYATELGMYVIIDWHIELRQSTPLRRRRNSC